MREAEATSTLNVPPSGGIPQNCGTPLSMGQFTTKGGGGLEWWSGGAAPLDPVRAWLVPRCFVQLPAKRVSISVDLPCFNDR
jgi:hypothetical protein